MYSNSWYYYSFSVNLKLQENRKLKGSQAEEGAARVPGEHTSAPTGGP